MGAGARDGVPAVWGDDGESGRVTRRLWVVIAVCLLAAGCAVLAAWPKVCADGGPVKVLTDPGCHRGVCGWSCVPGRWGTGAAGK